MTIIFKIDSNNHYCFWIHDKNNNKKKRYMFWFTCKTLKWVFVAGKALINLSTMLLMHFFTGLLGWSVH
jgi:hypothetical protein